MSGHAPVAEFVQTNLGEAGPPVYERLRYSRPEDSVEVAVRITEERIALIKQVQLRRRLLRMPTSGSIQ